MISLDFTSTDGVLAINLMEIFKHSIGGVSYGVGITEFEKGQAQREGRILNEIYLWENLAMDDVVVMSMVLRRYSCKSIIIAEDEDDEEDVHMVPDNITDAPRNEHPVHPMNASAPLVHQVTQQDTGKRKVD
ncbi:uncharacterized protein LOC122040960 [Zingiber officinale]|uniref:uncharacterized protein LOC122040960 n=1 Tax=Zingiber officinale TaxID=94328 RepID=UPI001C4BE5E2|nr:uncharacterized protein LOC122040960 [Zingiber officinale]